MPAQSTLLPSTPPPRQMTRRRQAIRLVLLLSVSWVVLVIFLRWIENRLVFRPATAEEYWETAPSPEIQDVVLTQGDEWIHCWWLLPAKNTNAGAILFCHGNGGNLSGRGAMMLRLREATGCGVLIFDYPGYGRSSGRPSEQGCCSAADQASDWLTHTVGIPTERITLYGESLGGGVAVELASRRPYRALVLVKTFTSLPAVAKRIYPFLPTHMLMSNRFESLRKLPRFQGPSLIVGATEDSIVPYAMSEELFRIANEPKRFVRLAGHDHNDTLPDEFFLALSELLR